jgi:hypothetical protein
VDRQSACNLAAQGIAGLGLALPAEWPPRRRFWNERLGRNLFSTELGHI